MEERITHIQGNQRCLRRAIRLMALPAFVAAAGLGYYMVLIQEYPIELSDFGTSLLAKASCILGLSSLICLFAFLARWCFIAGN